MVPPTQIHSSQQGERFPLGHQVTPGSLAWMPCADQGFVTVKLLSIDINTRSAQVEPHPEGEASVAAAHAAAAVVCSALEKAGGGKGLLANGVDHQQQQRGGHAPAQPQSVSVTKEESIDRRRNAWMMSPPEVAIEAFADPLSPRGSHGLVKPSVDSGPEDNESCNEQLNSDSLSPDAGIVSTGVVGGSPVACPDEVEAVAAAAAAEAAAAATAAFVAGPSLKVSLRHLWPYSAPPLPPYSIPDDTASCGSLSAAALLQQLQHRYLRNEIYTYAAHVLLAVNPYKPLPHLYSAQQILLYRHWREVARAYRRQLDSEESGSRRAPLLQQCSNTSCSDPISSILDNPSTVLPLTLPSLDDTTVVIVPSGRADADTTGNQWARNNSLEADAGLGTAEAAAAAATENLFKEKTARVNRPPPHPFVVAEEALRRLEGTQTNQTIVVSGQSGAGKTETSKQLIVFLTHVSTSSDSEQLASGKITGVPNKGLCSALNAHEQRRQLAALMGGVKTLREAAELRRSIVSCNAIFESFGNAATRKNNNSSRVGRLTLLHFDNGGFLRGGSLRTYLLEAARLTSHKKGDRNFHVFYQLIRGSTQEERKALGLTDQAASYKMLQPQNSHKLLQKVFLREQRQDTTSQVDRPEGEAEDGEQVRITVDQENFRAMVGALKQAKFSGDEINQLLQLLAGLLHLSNVSFVEGQGGLLEVQDKAAKGALKHAASQLGLKESELKELLCCRRMRLKGDTVITQRSQQQSISTCCSVIKFIYSRLFEYIVNRLNEGTASHMKSLQQQLNPSTHEHEEGNRGYKSIGILDIYGFECFGLENGLEQLCINYANEKQQQLFIHRVIKEEIALYAREGITNPAVSAGKKQLQQERQLQHERSETWQDLHASFKTSLEHSLFAAFPDGSRLLQDLQEGVFRRLDDNCRLLAQGQQREDLHFWKDLFSYCVSTSQQQQHQLQQTRKQHFPQQPRTEQKRTTQFLLFCLKGIYGARAAEAAAGGQLLQQLQHEDLTSIGLVAADSLASRGGKFASSGTATTLASAGKVQERVFAVKHFAGTVLYGTDGWLDFNNDRIEYELESLVASSSKSLLREAMDKHEALQQQEGTSTVATGGGQFSSITKRFVKSVRNLSQELQGPQMQLHFIRCFIPNSRMQPNNFDRKIVLQQLQHSGTLVLVDILHSGFPHRLSLRSAAARLRAALEPLVCQRRQEQEQRVAELVALRDQRRHTSADGTTALNEDIQKQQRMLATLRHCSLGSVRDRTLVSATLGLLPQCRPGSFICGVSLICLKAAAYGEAAALMADPSQYFKTPNDLCQLIMAIQRLRWRVAVRIVLQVHPTLLWLQRRSFLMRRIKEETAKTAVRLLLLKKHILIPLRERSQKRFALRRGVCSLEHLLLRRGFRTLRKYRAAGESKKVTGATPMAAEGIRPLASKKPPPALDPSAMQTDCAIATVTVRGDQHPQHGVQPWNTLIFPLTDQKQHTNNSCQEVLLHPGRGLYVINFVDPSPPDADRTTVNRNADRQTVEVQSLPTGKSVDHHHKTQQHADAVLVQAVGGGDSTTQTLGDGNISRGAVLVSIAKHPSYTNLFLASNCAAQLLLLSAIEADSTADRLGYDRDKRSVHSPAETPSTPFSEPSTSLPLLRSPSGQPAGERTLPNVKTNGISVYTRDYRQHNTDLRVKMLPALPEWLGHCHASNGFYPSKFLPKSPIPPSKWLPRDLLQLVANTSKHQSLTPKPRPPTVRPLRVSFAHPVTADFALVVCLVQGHSSNTNTGSSMGKLAVVLVDLTRREPAGWIPLSFAANDISACARRHSSYLQQLCLASPSGHSSSNSTSSKNCGAAESSTDQGQRSNARSNVLSTIRLQPLWGSMWAVVGPSLLAIFSVNLRLYQHPPANSAEQLDLSQEPLSLLWNSPSIPRISGMNLQVAGTWFTGCTYTRVAPPGLESVSGTDPVVQFLQIMPHGTVARSLEAKMQSLLLLSTADNSLVLMQWGQKRSNVWTDSGNLVVLDQVQLPCRILQFLRQDPGREARSSHSPESPYERGPRLQRTFPWEADLLLQPLPTAEATRSPNPRGRCPDSDCSTIGGYSDAGESDSLRHQPHVPHTLSAGTNRVGALIRDFRSYGLAVVEKNEGRVLRSLDEQIWQQSEHSNREVEGQVLAVTPLPSHPGVLASVRSLPHGGMSLCLGDEQGNWRTVGEFALPK